MSSTSLLGGFVATVHDVRRGLHLEGKDALSEEEEVELIMEQLSRLDGLENCNELELARRLKRELLLHVPAPQQGDDDEGMTVQGLSSGGGGLEAVRRQILQEVSSSATELLESEETQWLDFVNSDGKGSKKQKSSGYFSFNFDDIPMFEPLEHTLAILRRPFPECAAAIPKLMELDTSELLEHPQWRELVDLLFTTFEAAESKHRAQILHLHVRFMHSMQGQQSADISINLLKIFRKRWLRRAADDDDVATPSNQPKSGDEEEQRNVAVFLDVLVHILPQMQYCDSRTTDHFVATLFLLLTGGLAFHGTVPLLDLMTGEISVGLLGLVRARPISVALHAIGSSLFSALSIRLQATPGGKKLSDCILFFGLLRPLSKFPLLVELISSNQIEKRFMWDGRMNKSEDEVFLVIMPNTNRTFYQLSSASSPFELLLLQQDTETTDVGSFYKLVSACCSLLSANFKSDSVSGSEEAEVKRLVLLLLEMVSDGPRDAKELTIQSLLHILHDNPSSVAPSLLQTFVDGLHRVTLASEDSALIDVWIQVTELAFARLQSRHDQRSSLNSLIVNGILPTWTNQCLLSAGACRPCAPNSILSVTLLQLCNFCVEQVNPGDMHAFNIIVVYLAAMLLGNTQLLVNHNNGLVSKAVNAVLIALSASSVVEQSLLVSSLLGVAKLCGPEVLTMSPALHSVALETLNKFLTSPNVWDDAHAPLNSTIPLFQLLVQLARDGHTDTAFEVFTLASPVLQSHCHDRKIDSAKAFLLAGNPDDDDGGQDGYNETGLTSQGMYPLLLRMLNAGLNGEHECISMDQIRLEAFFPVRK